MCDRVYVLGSFQTRRRYHRTLINSRDTVGVRRRRCNEREASLPGRTDFHDRTTDRPLRRALAAVFANKMKWKGARGGGEWPADRVWQKELFPSTTGYGYPAGFGKGPDVTLRREAERIGLSSIDLQFRCAPECECKNDPLGSTRG